MPASWLRNMSVPPRSTILVKRPGFEGPVFAGNAALLKGGAPSEKKLSPPQVEKLLRDALEVAGIPDRLGVFLPHEIRQGVTHLPRLAVLALLARRSGPLYIPWRSLSLAAVEPRDFLLVFPEEGDPE